MIHPQVKMDIDRLWLEFTTGGIVSSLTIIEQISCLIFARLLDMEETRLEKNRTCPDDAPHHFFRADQQALRWKNWSTMRDGDAMLAFVRDEVFPHLRMLGGEKYRFGEYMRNVSLQIPNPGLLVSAVQQLDKLPLDDRELRGELYEYLLGKLTTAGIHGQFRTPAEVTRLMVELIDPRPSETIGDPACGTGGLLVEAAEYLHRTATEPGETCEEDTGSGPDAPLQPCRDPVRQPGFYGLDFDATMLRLAAMNLMLHGVENPELHYMDTLSGAFPEKFPALADGDQGGLDVILSNPPFRGAMAEEVHPSLLRVVQTRKSELLFVALALRMLRRGGRCAMIVPDGVLCGSSKAHWAVREQLVEHNRLEAVIALPAGVFPSFSGLATAILVFTRGGCTENVLFYDAQANAALRGEVCWKDAAPTLSEPVIQYRRWRSEKCDLTDRTATAFQVPAVDIRANHFDLSIGRYREIRQLETGYEEPGAILERMRLLEEEIQCDLAELGAMLR